MQETRGNRSSFRSLFLFRPFTSLSSFSFDFASVKEQILFFFAVLSVLITLFNGGFPCIIYKNDLLRYFLGNCCFNSFIYHFGCRTIQSFPMDRSHTFLDWYEFQEMVDDFYAFCFYSSSVEHCYQCDQ